MEAQLKDAIIKSVQENKTEFQLLNATKDKFRNYIFNEEGNYLIGGEKVHEFISQFIKLYI